VTGVRGGLNIILLQLLQVLALIGGLKKTQIQAQSSNFATFPASYNAPNPLLCQRSTQASPAPYHAAYMPNSLQQDRLLRHCILPHTHFKHLVWHRTSSRRFAWQYLPREVADAVSQFCRARPGTKSSVASSAFNRIGLGGQTRAAPARTPKAWVDIRVSPP
jgi:hypothetical protein